MCGGSRCAREAEEGSACCVVVGSMSGVLGRRVFSSGGGSGGGKVESGGGLWRGVSYLGCLLVPGFAYYKLSQLRVFSERERERVCGW